MHRDSSQRLHDSVPHAVLARKLHARDAALAKSPLAKLGDVREARKHMHSYVESHRAVARAGERLSKRHLRKGRSLDVELLALDAAYQRWHARLRTSSAVSPAVPTLSGRDSFLSAAGALQAAVHLVSHGRLDRSERGLIERAREFLRITDTAEYQGLARAHAARASALGPALRALRSMHHQDRHRVVLSAAAGSGNAASSSAPDYGSSVVRVLVSDEFAGTGFMVRPTVVVTAAHVVGSASSSAVRVQDSSGNDLDVASVTVNAAWAASQQLDHDAAIVLVSAVDGAGLPILWDFAVSGGSYEVARYGYPADGSPSYAVGTLTRADTRFFTADAGLQIPAGESGCPLLYEAGSTVSAVGIGTARSDPGNTRAFIGIPMLESILPAFN